jgi:hypothetical protein
VSERGIDILVVSPTGHPDLVVEVKVGENLDAATDRVADYMRRVGASVGIVINQATIRILRETFRGRPSIRVIGDFPTALAPSLRTSGDESDFEDGVQLWLESLRHARTATAEPLSSALVEHVLPAIADGTVRAAGPRTRSATG